MPFSPHSCKSYAVRAVRELRSVLYAILVDALRPNVDAAFASARPYRKDSGLPVLRLRLDVSSDASDMDIAALGVRLHMAFFNGIGQKRLHGPGA